MLARLRPVTRVLCPPGAARALGTAAKASPPHLLSLADLQVPHIAAVLQRAAELKAMSRASDRAFVTAPAAGKHAGGATLPQSLAGRNIAIIFAKRSTRTRVASETSVAGLGEFRLIAVERRACRTQRCRTRYHHTPGRID
jgi:ornithine carbamoyltransferase